MSDNSRLAVLAAVILIAACEPGPVTTPAPPPPAPAPTTPAVAR